MKEIEYLTETEGFIKKKMKPNFQALRQKIGSENEIGHTALSNFSQHEISLFEKEGRYSVPLIDELRIVTLSRSRNHQSKTYRAGL